VIELEAEDKLPAESEDVAVITLLPAVKVPVVHENAPLPLAVHVLPVATPPTYNCTMELASAVPVITKDVFFVIKSLLDDPVSLLEASTRLEGAEGGVVSAPTGVTVNDASDASDADTFELLAVLLNV
jgi:hypothetical protein